MLIFELKKQRRRRLARRPLPASWAGILDRNVPYYRLLEAPERRRLHGLIHVFLAEKRFEGCGGLVLTDEIRVTIAAQACILLLGRDSDVYPTLRSILVYPHAYLAQSVRRGPDRVVREGRQARRGESSSSGLVVLSWDAVLHDASAIDDGHNLVFHEFAHQLDLESGAAEGTPALPRRSMYIAWARVLGREYETLVRRVESHRPSLLDGYGATNPAEFFAVATECFFERPVEMRALHRELYDQLASFYASDPAARVSGRRPEDAER